VSSILGAPVELAALCALTPILRKYETNVLHYARWDADSVAHPEWAVNCFQGHPFAVHIEPGRTLRIRIKAQLLQSQRGHSKAHTVKGLHDNEDRAGCKG
jgi:hypothetical protein